MSTHYARVSTSARLRRVYQVLRDGREHTTMQIMLRAHVCAVNAIVAELRSNGYAISCQRRGDVWFYRMDPASAAPVPGDHLRDATKMVGATRKAVRHA